MAENRGQVNFQETRHSERYQQLDRTTRSIFEAMSEGHVALRNLLSNHIEMSRSRHDETNGLVAETSAQILASVDTVVRHLNASTAESTRADGEVNAYEIENSILQSLSFPELTNRHDAVADAHTKTFAWIFQPPEEQPWDHFTTWLESRDDIYWITGKAASGKSTLMKYIYHQHKRVDQSLRVWAGKTHLIKADFFFWSTGSRLQKSQAGLLRTLLHKVLSECRSLIPLLFPELWRKRDLQFSRLSTRERVHFAFPVHPWPLQQLCGAFESLLQQKSEDVSLCFFVDGLDEFEGDHGEIAALLKKASIHRNVKICLSSRPLMIFEQEFDACPSLRLQDLTFNDMFIYVHDKLDTHKRLEELRQTSPVEVQQLIREIVEMSSGVFLWITLVVRSLLEGLTNLDSTSDLRERLQELPPELDDLFNHMLRSIRPKFYLQQASRLFQIVYHSLSPLSALALSYADDKNSDLAIRSQIKDTARNDEAARVQEISARIKTRCAGLLEVYGVSDYGISEDAKHAKAKRSKNGLGDARRIGVRYLHLTVKEFLEKPTVWTMLLDCTRRTGFDAITALLRSNVMMLKSSLRSWNATTWKLIHEAMRYAARAENSMGVPQVALLDELDRAAAKITLNSRRLYDPFLNPGVSWTASMHGIGDGCPSCPESFLTFAMMHGLSLYVKAKLFANPRLLAYPNGTKARRSILEYATFCRPKCKNISLHPPLLAAVLEAGANPNKRFGKETPWEMVLKFLLNDGKLNVRAIGSDWIDICKIYVLYGADPNQEVPQASELSNSITALEAAGKVFAHLPQGPVEDLRALLFQAGARPPSRNQARHGKRKAEGKRFPEQFMQRTTLCMEADRLLKSVRSTSWAEKPSQKAAASVARSRQVRIKVVEALLVL